MLACVARCIRVFRKFYVPYSTVLLSVLFVTLHYSNDNSSLKQEFALVIPVDRTTAWWKFFTPALVHQDEVHLWSNTFILLSAGIILELIQGTLTTFSIFWIGSTTGTLLYAAFFGDNNIRLFGASAGCYAIVAAYLSYLLMNWKETPFKCIWLISLIIIIGLEIYVMIQDSQILPGQINVAYAAHIGGFLQGLLVGLFTVKNYKILCWEVIVMSIAYLTASIFILSLSLQIGSNV